MPGASPQADRAAQPTGRVLIVDDSAVARAVIARAIDGSADYAVAGAVPTTHAALAFLQVEAVDFVLLDIEMPGVDGLTALPDIIAAAPGAKVIVVSSTDEGGAGGTVQALALGAVDKVSKPAHGGLAGGFAERLLATLAQLSRDVASPSPSPSLSPSSPPPALTRVAPARAGALPGFDPCAYDIVAIGASTGGIHALSSLLRALPADMQLPILITQHLPHSFMPYFAAQVAVLAGRPCEVATDCMRVRPGRVIIAPGDAHIRCVRLPDRSASIRLLRASSVSGCTPSVDPMLASVAEVFGARALAVMLSGMGRDGADGARAVRDAGGCVLAQDRATSVVWGMPGAVSDIAAAFLDPETIGALIAGCRKP
ncbi:chemotaxis protein CheB [Sphingomonas sp.]|uniref:chemotaxis protein CheB n=1 Tax=Sphingomonas sp. TaxID=28214 RepID=UPI0035BC6E1F